MRRVVVDPSVLVSAAITARRTPPDLVVRAAVDGAYVLYAGLTVPGHVGERLREDEDLNDWRAALTKDGVAISVSGKETNLFCARSVAQIAAEASSFDGQAEHLKAWMGKALQAASRLPPASWTGSEEPSRS